MRPLSICLAAAATLALGAGAAQAQTRDGFFAGLSVGFGSARVGCGNCDLVPGGADTNLGEDREGGFAGHLRVGKTLSTRLAVGAELDGWVKSYEFDSSVRLWDATLAFYLYPRDQGLFVKGGVGVSHITVKLGDLDASLGGTGLGLMAGLGYDFAVGHSMAVTPTVTYWYGKPGSLSLEGVDLAADVSHNVIEIGVGFSFY